MKLYYSPAACSMSPHIALRESGLPFELVQVDLRAKKTLDGEDFLAISPKGQVPALQLDDGQLITEGPAIVQYIADRVPEKKLAPAAGTVERYRVQEWLNFVATELHKNFGLIFKYSSIDGLAAALSEAIVERVKFIAPHLEQREWLVGDHFTVADGYLFTALTWCRFIQIDLAPWPSVTAFMERVAARPAVREVLKVEGLA